MRLGYPHDRYPDQCRQKDKFSELIRRAEAGETITRFGKPVMDMVPLKKNIGFNLREDAPAQKR